MNFFVLNQVIGLFGFSKFDFRNIVLSHGSDQQCQLFRYDAESRYR